MSNTRNLVWHVMAALGLVGLGCGPQSAQERDQSASKRAESTESASAEETPADIPADIAPGTFGGEDAAPRNIVRSEDGIAYLGVKDSVCETGIDADCGRPAAPAAGFQLTDAPALELPALPTLPGDETPATATPEVPEVTIPKDFPAFINAAVAAPARFAIKCAATVAELQNQFVTVVGIEVADAKEILETTKFDSSCAGAMIGVVLAELTKAVPYRVVAYHFEMVAGQPRLLATGASPQFTTEADGLVMADGGAAYVRLNEFVPLQSKSDGITLDGATLTVNVTDGGAGLDVSVFALLESLYLAEEAMGAAQTDATGAVQISGMVAGTYVVRISGEGKGTKELLTTITAGDSGKELTTAMPAAATGVSTVKIAVVSPRGLGLRAVVALVDETDPTEQRIGITKGGIVEFTGLSGGRYAASAVRPGWTLQTAATPVTVTSEKRLGLSKIVLKKD